MLNLDKLKRLDNPRGSTIEDYCFLYGITCLLRPRRIAEVGTNTGLSAIVMAQALQDMELRKSRVYTCDTDAVAITHAAQQIAEYGIDTDLIQLHTGDVQCLPLFWYDLTFIDGSHLLGHVILDIETLYRRSRVILLHDATQCPDVKRAIDDCGLSGTHIKTPDGHMWSRGSVVHRSAPGWFLITNTGEPL